VLRPGKLPVSLLSALTRQRGAPDSTVVVGPAFGEDAAVIDLGPRLLVLTTDPVTFTTSEVGWYAVHVNANDIAVMGARPRWFQPTIILPPGSSNGLPLEIARDIHRAARSLGVSVTGGHTEVSDAVERPIVAGDMQGLVARDRLIRSSGARPGDAVILTKSAGIEGTAIIAREHARVARRVLGRAGHARAARFHHRPGISVVPDARIAARHRASALHDATEGGVAAALHELAVASGCRLEIDLDEIPVHPYTQQLCAHFGLDPLGLIGSGALLGTLRPRNVKRALHEFAAARIAARIIGRVARGRGIAARRAGRRVRFAWSTRDELTRLPTP
jgi:hydrogenase expression/formation protein HypE